MTSYGEIAEILGRGGPRLVAQVMSRYGSEVPWHRVLRANGTCAAEVAHRQIPLLRQEGTPFRPGTNRVDMARAGWPGSSDPVPGQTRPEQADLDDATRVEPWLK